MQSNIPCPSHPPVNPMSKSGKPFPGHSIPPPSAVLARDSRDAGQWSATLVTQGFICITALYMMYSVLTDAGIVSCLDR